MYPEVKERRVNELLEVVDMLPYAQTKVKFLSGGQQQRVALAKVLAKEPKVLLLDEPFSHIDQFRKNDLRVNLFSYLKKNQISCIVATHDAKDALSFADQILLMKSGKTVVEGSPRTLYENPLNAYVASFFNRYSVLPTHYVFESSNLKQELIIYPEEIYLDEKANFKGTVEAVFFEGDCYLVYVQFRAVLIKLFHSQNLKQGQEVAFNFDTEKLKKRIKAA